VTRVTRVLPEITACQTVLPLLVIQWYVFSWLPISVSPRFETEEVS